MTFLLEVKSNILLMPLQALEITFAVVFLKGTERKL